MPVDEYMSLKKLIDEKEAIAQDLTRKLVEARSTDPKVVEGGKLSRSAIAIIQFAMGNCAPAIIKRWPWKELLAVADSLKELPDFSIYDEELAAEMRKFAAECEKWDIKRRTEPEKEIPPPFPVQEHPVVQIRAGIVPESARKLTMVTPPGIDSIDQELLSKRTDQSEQDVEPNS
jgi:hypothetical protein